MRIHGDSRLTVAREGQIEWRSAANASRGLWDDSRPHPLGGRVKDGVPLLRGLPEFKPYVWRDPARVKPWRGARPVRGGPAKARLG